MKNSGLYEDILMCINRLAYNADSLLRNMNNNAAEQYNSIVAKFVGGKRINYSMKGSYEMRCEAAAISYNNTGEYFAAIHKSAVKKSPGIYTKKFTSRRNMSREYNTNYKRNSLRRVCRKFTLPDQDYGPNAQIPDMLPEVYEEMAKNFLNQISCSADDISKI